ncbi:MAG: prolipoprotein diacylglyceryl transferase, partial [Thermoflexales bacterium]|nr:prolipoprotein diacylglyceryl transferase [Thermoflexales bacterium]
YSLLVASAVALCVLWLYRLDATYKSLLGVIALALSSLVAGQLGYWALHWDALREGALPKGLSEHTAILGAWLCYRLMRRWLPAHLGASLWTVIGLVGAAACLGCIPNGCGFGREVSWQTEGEQALAWQLHVDWPDMTLTHAPRLPTQALLAGWLALGTLLSRLRPTAEGAEIGIAWFATGDFLVQFLRGDDIPVWGDLRLYQWLDLVMLTCGVTALLWTWVSNKGSSRVNYGTPINPT